ncbi:YybH family protein [Chryseobacterium sp. PTM-20240506]|uniref:YybH family protein n=1 Tax=unclassified Chryseobacterium TaxID=2593645 RepID=UPI002359E1DD|nr:hypothetical protein [Chryseobacterium sp. B21-037]MDC8107141.1 hypothetical protein [Chryseobacterium sp. B21-037]
MTPEVEQVIQVVAGYNRTLKEGSLSNIMRIFNEDSVLIPENQRPISGLKDIEKVYTELVNVIKFNEGNIINIMDAYVAGDLAYVRSVDTTGSVTEIKSGEVKSPIFRELWVLKKDDKEKWTFAIYAYGVASQEKSNLADAVVW